MRFARLTKLRITMGFAFGICLPSSAEEMKDSASVKKSVSSKKLFDYRRLTGLTARAVDAYKRAAEIPEVLDQLFCYCGCDITEPHRTALDCFTSPFAADMNLCQEQALLAYSLSKKNCTIGQIQKLVDELYADKYPYAEKSKDLINYESSRQYKSVIQPRRVHVQSEREYRGDYFYPDGSRPIPGAFTGTVGTLDVARRSFERERHINSGVDLQSRKLYTGAIQEYMTALELDRDHECNDLILCNIASAFQQNQELDQAEICYRKTLMLNPNQTGAKAGLQQISEIRKPQDP